MRDTYSDKALLASALALALSSAVGFAILGGRQVKREGKPLSAVELATMVYRPVAAEAPAIETRTWTAPVAQPRGPEWIYDTFTPPEIYYNARSKQFTVTPPSSLRDTTAREPFGLELMALRPEPFRLQLIGYVGGEGRWRGTFQNLLSGEVFLASGGRQVPELGLTITDFEVRAQPIGSPKSMKTRQRVATAVVRDEKTGRAMTLTQRERCLTGTVFALVAPAGKAAREVRSGDAFTIGAASYRIEKIQSAPPTVEVIKESPTLAEPDRRVLTPRERNDAGDPEARGGGGEG